MILEIMRKSIYSKDMAFYYGVRQAWLNAHTVVVQTSRESTRDCFLHLSFAIFGTTTMINNIENMMNQFGIGDELC